MPGLFKVCLYIALTIIISEIVIQWFQIVLKVKKNITTIISMVNYPYTDLFLADPRLTSRNRGSQENPYSSRMKRDSGMDFA